VAAGRAGRQRRVVDVLEQRLALLVLDLVLLPLGHDVDRGAVERGRDLAGVEGAVVVGVVPGQATLVAAVLPEPRHEFRRLDGALALEHDLLVRLVGLGGAEGPGHRVGEGRGIAEGVAERLAVRLALLPEPGEQLARLVPRLRVVAGARFFEPRLAVGDGVADDRVRHREPLAVDLAGGRPHLVEAALRLGQGARHLAHVDDGVLVEVRPVVLEVEDVSARARLDGAVMRGCRSLALIVSNWIFAPSAFSASGIWRLSSRSDSGMKSTQRTQCRVLPCANAGACRAARIPAMPVILRKYRRSIDFTSIRESSLDSFNWCRRRAGFQG